MSDPLPSYQPPGSAVGISITRRLPLWAIVLSIACWSLGLLGLFILGLASIVLSRIAAREGWGDTIRFLGFHGWTYATGMVSGTITFMMAGRWLWTGRRRLGVFVALIAFGIIHSMILLLTRF